MIEPDCAPCTIQNWPAFDVLLGLSLTCLIAMVWAALGYGLIVAVVKLAEALRAFKERRLEALHRRDSP